MYKEEMTSKKIKVLIINTKFCGGGAEKVARQLYYGLKSDTIETFFFEGFHADDSPIEFYSYKMTNASKIFSKIDKLITNNSRNSYPKTVKLLDRIIEKYSIDIIHLNNIHGGYIGIKDLQRLSQKCRIVWTLHDMWAMTGHCAHSISCDKWKTDGCDGCKHLDIYPRLIFDNAKKNLTLKTEIFAKCNITFVTPSKWLSDCLKESAIRPHEVIVINNGVDLTEFKMLNKKDLREKYGYSNKDIIILCIANSINSRFKGFSILMDALQNLNHKEDYIVIFAGKLHGEIRIEGLRVVQTGYIENTEKLNELYSIATVTVVPSVAETFPCVILESYACGTPVIANDTCGMAEMIYESTGRKFLKNNSSKLREELEAIRSDDHLNKLGGECREMVEKHYSEEEMLHKYTKLYLEMMERERV